jgi:hypothetical protein
VTSCLRASVRPRSIGPLGPLGIGREVVVVMLSTSTSPATTTDQDLRPRARALSWMASLSVAAGDMRAAEGYLLELLAWCAFADRDAPQGEPDEADKF